MTDGTEVKPGILERVGGGLAIWTVVFAAALCWAWSEFAKWPDGSAASVSTVVWVGGVISLVVVAVLAVILGARREVKLWISLLLLLEAVAFIVLAFAIMYWGRSNSNRVEFGGKAFSHVEATYFALGTLTGGTGPFNATSGTGLQLRMAQIAIDYIFTTFAVGVVAARFSEWVRKEWTTNESSTKGGGKESTKRRWFRRKGNGSAAQPTQAAAQAETTGDDKQKSLKKTADTKKGETAGPEDARLDPGAVELPLSSGGDPESAGPRHKA